MLGSARVLQTSRAYFTTPLAANTAASPAASPDLALSLGSSQQCSVSQSQVPPLDITSLMALVPIQPTLRSLGCWKRRRSQPRAPARSLLPEPSSPPTA